MSNTVAPHRAQRRAGRGAGRSDGRGGSAGGLYTRQGTRKYLTRGEQQRLLAVCESAVSDTDLLALTLLWTGARVSEALALTADAFQLEAGVAALRTLKRRRPVIREVPVPPALMEALDARFGLSERQRSGDGGSRLWRCCRATAWRHVKAMMEEAGIHGRHACPRGLRHGFGVGTLQSGVPLTLVQRWLGHARLTTTAIYAEVSGPEEAAFAATFHRWTGEVRS